MAKKVQQMIEEQVHFWKLKHTPKQTSGLDSKHPVITISREFGAKGAELAKALESRIGFKVWDKELLQIISEKLDSKDSILESLDENHRSLVEDTIFGFMNQRGTNLNYLLYLVRAVRAIENIGGSIIVGRGANYICRHSKSFHTRVVAPLKTRVEQYAFAEHTSKDQALVLITKKDKERKDFVMHNFNHEIDDPADYDVVINSASFSMDEMVEIVIAAYEQKSGVQVSFQDALL